MKTTKRTAPFLKWAGGKSRLLSVFDRYFPKSYGTYFEPFLGAGAVFFHLTSKDMIAESIISDSNMDLMNCYSVTRNRLKSLLSNLRILQKRVNDKSFYYSHVRPRFNQINLDNGLKGNVEKASLLIYLNKTCYNGLYRVNSKGEFNVPWGRYKSPRILDESNLRAVSSVLNKPGVRIMCDDYAKVAQYARKGDFVYFDPPYQPLSRTASFTSYTANNFELKDQIRLARLFQKLDSRGCLLMLSNSPRAESLYAGHGYRIERVKAARAINSVGGKRGPVDEILVMNY